MATITLARSSRTARVRNALSPGEWTSLGGMAAFILLLHVVGWGVLAAIVAPAHYRSARPGFGIGLGLTAYTLGMRHAFDADHIAAIDNTTRKLMAEGKRPVSVGFWFSLGHSSVVFALVRPDRIGCKGAGRSGGERLVDLAADHRPDRHGGLGDVPLHHRDHQPRRAGRHHQGLPPDARRALRRGRAGGSSSTAAGFMNRLLAGVTRAVTKPWQMYPVGLLFGLGFDTATEVGPARARRRRGRVQPALVRVLTLPILFAAGMSLLDTIDGVLHELRLRLGVLPAGPQGLLQHHDHRAVGGGGAHHRRRSSSLSILTDEARHHHRPARRDRRSRPQPRRLRASSASSSPPGSSHWRSGSSAGSRRNGRRTFRSGPARTDAPR